MSELRVPAAMSKLKAWIGPADEDARELPLVHRLAIIYLMLPVAIWLVGWFEWWLGVPAAVLLALAFGQALSGSWRVGPRVAAVAVLVVAACWVMASGAGGVFDTSLVDWLGHRTRLLELGRHPWPTFLPEPLAAYAPDGASPFPLLRYYLGYYMTPGLAAHWFGSAALNWAVPLWTWSGVALILLMFTRERRGWGVALSLLIFIFFSGMDILWVILTEGWGWIDLRIEWDGLPGIGLGTDHIDDPVVPIKALSNMTSLLWNPHHFIPAGLYTLLMLQLRGHRRFLAVSGVLLGAAPFWSAFVAVGLLPLAAVLLWENGVRPFLRLPNLLLAVPLAALIALYLTSGSTDFPNGWIWERYEWSLLARWMPVFYLSEFLLIGVLLWVLRPGLRREPFFIASMATLVLLPLYYYSAFNVLLMRASLPPLLLLCWYCTETLTSGVGTNAWGWTFRLGVACLAAILAIGAVTAVVELARATKDDGVFRFEEAEYTLLTDLPQRWQMEGTAYEIPNALRLLLDEDEFAPLGRERGELVIRSEFDVYLEEDNLVLVKERCGRDDLADRFFLYTVPVDPANLPVDMRSLGFDYSHSWRDYWTRMIGGSCIVRLSMPEYAVAGFRVGQWAQGDGADWEADYNFEVDLDRTYRSLTAGEPVIRSEFDVYLTEDRLTYTKEPCEPADAKPIFFLHVFPVDHADLPRNRRQHGFDNLDFTFSQHGFLYGRDRCVASRVLPDYEAAKIRTGQYVGVRRVWSEEFSVAE